MEALSALESVEPKLGSEDGFRAKISKGEDVLKSALKDGFVSLEGYPPSAYLTQLTARVLRLRAPLDEETTKKISSWAWREIEHQLALAGAKSKTADPFQLGYSIALVSDVGRSSEATPDQGLILREALRSFFAAQLDDGTWPRSQPLFHYPKVGNAYCYEFELLTQLLSGDTLRMMLLPYLTNLSRAAYALDSTAYRLPNGGRGWSSGHHPQLEGPESWSTASVFHFLYNLDRIVAEAIRRAVFTSLDEVYSDVAKAKSDANAFAPGFLDCPLFYKGQIGSLKKTIYQQFVAPIAAEANAVADGRSMATTTPMSAIIFGPPGTSKTEITKQISEFLGWPRLTVDPSYFVRDGVDKIQGRAHELFRMLASSESIVVFLDEFDEMVRDRSDERELLSRFLTTAMLPKLATLNKSRRLVFIVATNHIASFDIAIKRMGRFDLIIQIMPPTYGEKMKRWPKVAEKLKEFAMEDANTRGHLEELTFDEFRALVPQIAGAQNKDAVRLVLKEAHESCTLETKTRASTQGGQSAEMTWRDVCKRDQQVIRLPLEKLSEP